MLKFIDFFAGIGTARMGFEKAGHNRNKCSRKVFPIRRESEYAPTQTEELREQVSNTLRTNYGGATSNETYIIERLCKTKTKGIVLNTMPINVRKLTLRECMRLQGVDDAVTDKLIAAGISDTQLYRSAGDAMTVNVLYEIAKNMGVD